MSDVNNEDLKLFNETITRLAAEMTACVMKRFYQGKILDDGTPEQIKQLLIEIGLTYIQNNSRMNSDDIKELIKITEDKNKLI